MKQNQSGFTLIEIAIVLVIIGLLLGGVLKGQELIQSAKIKNIIAEFSGTTVGFYGYQDRYKTIPGDDIGAVARWTTASGVANGDGNSILKGAFNSTATADESFQAWAHMRQAGFIGGSGGGGPTNAYNGVLGLQNGADSFSNGTAGTGFSGVIICESHVPDKAAAAIDNQLDDGQPNTGIVRAVVEVSGAVPPVDDKLKAATTYIETGTTYYTICKSL